MDTPRPPLPSDHAERVASDVRLFLIAMGLATITITAAYYLASYRRDAGAQDPDRIADAMLDAVERRELMRDAARRDAPPEV